METTPPLLEQEGTIRLLAHVKPEALPFLQEHGCIVEPQQDNDLVIFPPGSRQQRLSPISRRCSNIILPDKTVITVMDCNTRCILLLIDLSLGHTTHLTH